MIFLPVKCCQYCAVWYFACLLPYALLCCCSWILWSHIFVVFLFSVSLLLLASSVNILPFLETCILHWWIYYFNSVIYIETRSMRSKQNLPCWRWADVTLTSVATNDLLLSSWAGSAPRVIWQIIETISLNSFINYLTSITSARNSTNFTLKTRQNAHSQLCSGTPIRWNSATRARDYRWSVWIVSFSSTSHFHVSLVFLSENVWSSYATTNKPSSTTKTRCWCYFT